ncbi:MAG TPA: LysR substrate-binding domain-containing protein [Fibrobacteria bacterium]|nr:LysR substrate-binding domain-containing protein [Fibrobacteria bacterium]
MPSLVQLEYIVAVADHRHFGKAARACHVTQPTLSQQVRKVEDDLGILLFDRVKKPVVLTPEGEAFLEQARLILREHRRLKDMAGANSKEVAGAFHLAVIPTVSTALVPQFIERFAVKYPKVELYIDELKTETILESLRHDRLDAAILATPLPVTGFQEDPLYYEPFKLYVSKGHPLARHATCDKSDLDGAGLWLLSDGHCFKDQVVRYCSLAEDSAVPTFRNIHFQSGNLDTLRRLVRQGHGYTLIPAFMTTFMSEAEVKAHVRSFAAPEPTREISLVSRRGHWKQNITRALRESIARTLPEGVRTKADRRMEVLEVC